MKSLSKFIILIIYITLLPFIYSQTHLSLNLNTPTKGFIPKTSSYHYYTLTLPSSTIPNSKNLILRVDEDKTLLKNITEDFFSDPDLYVSQKNRFPNDTSTSTWYCNEFGSDIVAISKDFIIPNSIFYIAVYCKKKCNYILNSYLDTTYKLNAFVTYMSHIPKKKSMLYEFKVQKEKYDQLSIQFMGRGYNQFNVFISKDFPSSSNTFELEPAWMNGYTLEIFPDSKAYCLDCSLYILVKALDKDIHFRTLITYRGKEVPIFRGFSAFDTIKVEKNRCYYYSMRDYNEKDSIILNLILFGGSVFIKIFGFEKNDTMPYNEAINTEYTFDVIGERVLILDPEMIKTFFKKSNLLKYTDLHLCLYSKQKTSFLLGIHYSSHAQAIQNLNFLSIGQVVKDYLPINQVTKYKLIDYSYQSNIRITMEAIQGNPKMHFIFGNWENFIDKNMLNFYKNMGFLINPKNYGDIQNIFIPNESNTCHKKYKKALDIDDMNSFNCKSIIILECDDSNVNNKRDCIFKLSAITDKSQQQILQKTTYNGLLSKDDYNDYLFNIDDVDTSKITIVLNTISGELILSLYSIDKGEDNKVLIAERKNKDFLPKIINIFSSDDFFKEKKNLKGKYLIRIQSAIFSSFALYFYTNNYFSEKIDLYSIDLNLVNGQMIQDFFDTKKLFKIYTYELNEGANDDIRITVTQRNLDLDIYIYDNINKIKYSFENRNVKHLKNTDITKKYDKIVKFENYLVRNKYDLQQIIISKEDKILQEINKNKNLLYIVISKKYFSTSQEKNNISFLNQNTFYLGISNNIIPLKLFENIPHEVTLMNNIFESQKYLFVHSDNNKKLSFSINVIAGSVSFEIKINKDNKIYYKNDYITKNIFITISSEDLFNYCKNTGCELTLTISKQSDENPTYMLFAHSNDNKPLQLIPGILMQNQLQVGEKHFYILDFNPLEYEDMNKLGNVLMRYRGGKANMYMNFFNHENLNGKNFNNGNFIKNFPNENEYDYIAEPTYNGKILHLGKEIYNKCIPPNNNKNNTEINCRFYITIKGVELSFFKSTKVEYSLFYSHVIREIKQGEPYKSTIKAGEMQYYKFIFYSNTKGIYITLYSMNGDADLFVNYGNELPSFNKYIWKSSQLQMDFIYIDVNDNFFVENKKNSLEGVYTLMVYGYTNATYSIYVSQGENKITQLIPGIPAIGKIEKNESYCYFRVENFINEKIEDVDAGGLTKLGNATENKIINQDVHIVFTIKYIYGAGNIYVNLYEKTELNLNISDFPTKQKYEFANIQRNKRNFLKVDISKKNNKLTPQSMLLISISCYEKCLFELNSAKIEYDTDFQFIDIGRENLFYVHTKKEPLILSFLQKSNLKLNYEIYSYIGSGEAKIFTNETKKGLNKTTFDYHHIANFKIKENIPYYNYIELKNNEKSDSNKNKKEVFIKIDPGKVEEDFGFYIKLNYDTEWTKTENIGKVTTYQMRSKIFNGYIDVFSEYENIVLSVKSDDPSLKANVYVTINEKNFNITKNNYPSKNSYTYTGTTNHITNAVSIKIAIPERNKNYRIFYKVELEGDYENTNSNIVQTISVLVTPSVNNIQRFEGVPYKIYFTSQKNTNKAVFDLKKINKKDNMLFIEISSCKADVSLNAAISNKISYFNENSDKGLKIDKQYKQGRLLLIVYDVKDENYYLTVSGKKNNFFSKNSTDDVEFMLYYFSSIFKDFVVTGMQTNAVYLYGDKVKLDTSSLTIKKISEDTYKKLKSINYKVVMSLNESDFEYMSSLCYLSKIEKLPKGIKTEYKNKEIIISGLKKGIKYYTNLILQNPLTGELITLTPTVIEIPNENYSSNSYIYFIAGCVIVIILIGFVIYYRNKLIKVKNVINYEQNDIRNMATIPRDSTSSAGRQSNTIPLSKEIDANTKYINLNEEVNKI